MNGREILTLQFGHYANFVGAHWWNIQELSFDYNPSSASKPSEINHDVLFREGQTSKGEVTFTPRLLLTDLKGSLKSLSKEGNLYEEAINTEKVDALWFKPPEIKAETPADKNAFQLSLEQPESCSKPAAATLESEIDVWSDYLYSRYHPRTVNILNEYEHNISHYNNEFDAFPLGCKIWSSDYEDEFTDKIRLYIEECNSFQGFQILMDNNAFSGLGTSCIEYLHDEYETKTIFALPLIPGHYSNNPEGDKDKNIKDTIRVLNLAFSYTALAEEASLFTPLCVGEQGFRQPGNGINFNHLDYKLDKSYHTSAILASALDTFTLKYRLRSTAYALSDLAVDLTPHSRKAVAASLCLPFSLNADADLIDCLDQWDGPLSHSLTPQCKIGNVQMMQLITLRGISQDRLKRLLSHPQLRKQQDMPAYKCNSVAEMLQMYYNYTCHASATNVTSIEQGLSVKTPYPQLFKPEVNTRGNIAVDKRLENVGVDCVPVLAGLHSGSEIGTMLENLHTEARKVRIAKFHQFTEGGFSKDEFEECLDKLFTLRECYEDHYLI